MKYASDHLSSSSFYNSLLSLIGYFSYAPYGIAGSPYSPLSCCSFIELPPSPMTLSPDPCRNLYPINSSSFLRFAVRRFGGSADSLHSFPLSSFYTDSSDSSASSYFITIDSSSNSSAHFYATFSINSSGNSSSLSTSLVIFSSVFAIGSKE